MGGSEGMVGVDLVGPWGEFFFYFKPVGELLEKEMTTGYSCLENPMEGGAW